MYETSHGVGAESETVNATGWGFDPHIRIWNIYLTYNFIIFLRSDVEVNQGIVFRPSKQYASGI